MPNSPVSIIVLCEMFLSVVWLVGNWHSFAIWSSNVQMWLVLIQFHWKCYWIIASIYYIFFACDKNMRFSFSIFFFKIFGAMFLLFSLTQLTYSFRSIATHFCMQYGFYWRLLCVLDRILHSFTSSSKWNRTENNNFSWSLPAIWVGAFVFLFNRSHKQCCFQYFHNTDLNAMFTRSLFSLFYFRDNVILGCNK